MCKCNLVICFCIFTCICITIIQNLKSSSCKHYSKSNELRNKSEARCDNLLTVFTGAYLLQLCCDIVGIHRFDDNSKCDLDV
ncbi:hypothetical protein L6452_29407 [Arctium lappa]|uniref:Uncharacterized protein n=1 Tax=Arctium lappa TaxID=4217 RepID=A0ACB8ZHS4_ARCLA|nr:hypothetical protein L6452_29407 [Arctium lappa]